MWSSDARELAVFLAIFSVFWPYIKQLTTMVVWFSPPKFVSVSRRESILISLDSLGKWSFVDIFVLIMTLVGFKVAVMSPTGGFFDTLDLLTDFEGLYALNLYVVPCWGLYSNMIAQIVSQLSSHYVLHCHRKIVSDCLTLNQADTNLPNDGTVQTNTVKQALSQHMFASAGSIRKNVLRAVNVVLLVTTFAIAGLYLSGLFLPNFSIESYGILGVMMELGDNVPAAVKDYDILGVTNELVEQAKFTGVTSDYIGQVALSVVVVFTVLIVPLLLLLLLLYRWFVPMDEKSRWRNFILIETLSAWQYSEVFVLSIVVAAWQLGPLR